MNWVSDSPYSKECQREHNKNAFVTSIWRFYGTEITVRKGYLDDQGSIAVRGRDFSFSHQAKAVEPTLPPIQWVPRALSRG
jgi:hypothetical protein